MQAGEKLLLANKTTLLSGKDQQIIETVFYKIFAALSLFPEDYPKERLKSLLFSFFKKEELKFLYTYAMPIFPLSYTSYLLALESAGVQEWLRSQLRESHGWNLKMWVMVREKNILDRSNNDPDLLKWIDIIFKQACMLPGTLPDFLKLAFKLVNRYLDKVAKAEFSPAAFNRLVEQQQKVGEIVAQKILENTKEGLEFS